MIPTKVSEILRIFQSNEYILIKLKDPEIFEQPQTSSIYIMVLDDANCELLTDFPGRGKIGVFLFSFPYNDFEAKNDFAFIEISMDSLRLLHISKDDVISFDLTKNDMALFLEVPVDQFHMIEHLGKQS